MTQAEKELHEAENNLIPLQRKVEQLENDRGEIEAALIPARIALSTCESRIRVLREQVAKQ